MAEEKQRKIMKQIANRRDPWAEAAQEHHEGLKELGEMIGEDVLRQMKSPSTLGGAAEAIMAENAAWKATEKAEKEAATLAALVLRKAEEEAIEEERRRNQDDYDSGNNRRAAILAAKRRRAEREGLHTEEE